MASIFTEPQNPPTNDMVSVATSSAMCSQSLLDLVQALARVYQQNHSAALVMLGGQVLCTHYESVMEMASQVPAVVAFGGIAMGKTKAAEAALSLLDLPPNRYKISKITDTQAIRLASQTTLGFLIDDPSDISEVSEKILLHFERGSVASCAATYQPRCTFMLTMNTQYLRELAQLHNR